MAQAGYLRRVGDPVGTEWHDWNPEARSAEPEREERFNANHGKDGKFASGHGAGGRSLGGHLYPDAPHLHSDLAGIKDRLTAAAPSGVAVHMASGGPLNPRDRQALAKGSDRGKVVARITEHPQIEAYRDHGVTGYKVAGNLRASVHADEEGSKWTVQRHGLTGRDDVAHYASREKAEANAEKVARSYQRAGTETRYHAGNSAADLADRHLAPAHQHASPKRDLYTYVLREDAP